MKKLIIGGLLLGLVLSGNTAIANELRSPVSQTAMQPEYIEAIAARTTVVIAQDLKAREVEQGTAFNPGSGVIVARAGDIYYIATNLHVVRFNTAYGIRTYDGEIHVVTQHDDDYDIQRLGEQLAHSIRGFDLAMLTFRSDHDYPYVGVNLETAIAPGESTFVSGWPQPILNQPMNRQFSPGEIVTVQPPATDGGYGLFYTSATMTGMSGGPVFNDQGQVIGIHGRGENDRPNQGIQVDYLVRQAELARSLSELLRPLTFQTQPPDSATVARWMGDRPATDTQFDDPEAAFREAFRQAALRYCSGSRVDTGDIEEDCDVLPSR
jgi:serine protease Do